MLMWPELAATGAGEQWEVQLSVSEVNMVGWWQMPGVAGEW